MSLRGASNAILDLLHRSSRGLRNSADPSIYIQPFTSLRAFSAVPDALPDNAPRTYVPQPVPPRRWKPKRNIRKNPPEFAEGQVLFTLSHKDLRSFVNQAVDAIKKATQWKGGDITSGAMMHCLQSAAASRGKAFQLVQGQMFLVPKLNKLVTFATEGFMGKVAARVPDREWTVLRNQEICYDDKNCIVHHLAGYKVGERSLAPEDIIAKMPGPAKSPTSYQAFLKSEYIYTRPDWIMDVVLIADQLAPKRKRWGEKPKKIPAKAKFQVSRLKMKTLEEAGIPWYWVHNAWEARLQVYKHTTPHAAGGHFELVQEFDLESSDYDPAARAMPFEGVDVDLKSALGWRANRRAYA